MKPYRRPSVSLVTETGMFLLMCSPLISDCPLLSRQCSPRVRHWFNLLVREVDCCESVCKAYLRSDHFDSKAVQGVCWSAAYLPSVSYSLTTFALKSREVRRLLLALDPYGDTDPLGMFPLFLKRTADVLAPRLSVVFRQLVRLGTFRLAGDRPMSPQFRKVHRPPLLPVTDRFP